MQSKQIVYIFILCSLYIIWCDVSNQDHRHDTYLIQLAGYKD